MGNILAKNWKKLLIILGSVILAILLFYKISWKPNVIEEYKKSDIVITHDVIDSIKDTSKNVSEDAKEYVDEANKEAEEKTGSRSIVGWVGILIGAVFIILILDLLMQPKEDKKKKK